MDRAHTHERTGPISIKPESAMPIWASPPENQESLMSAPVKASAIPGSMDFESIGEIIATRRLHFVDESNNQRAVSVLVGKPQQLNGSSDYQCPFQVIGIGSQTTQLARGQDSIHALQSALILISASLNYLNNELGGKLNWDGASQGELGFP
jgi:hypothetical protein